MNRDKVLLLLLLGLIISAVAIALILYGPLGNIYLSCSNDYECINTCQGCINIQLAKDNEDCSPYLSLCKCVKNSCQQLLSEEQVMDIVEQKFPDDEKEAVLDMACGGKPCWIVNFTLGNSSGGGGGGESAAITVDASSGEIIETLCDYGECIECNYSILVNTSWGQIEYYNTGCEDAVLVCDRSNICRTCISEQECLTKTMLSNLKLDVAELITQYYYYIVDSSVSAHYNETSMNCTIYNGEVVLYSEIMTSDAYCEEGILAYVACDGRCIATI